MVNQRYTHCMQIVWFKRDLRIHDQPALSAAAQSGPVYPIYILEPDLWKLPDMSYRQYLFLKIVWLSFSVTLAPLGLI